MKESIAKVFAVTTLALGCFSITLPIYTAHAYQTIEDITNAEYSDTGSYSATVKTSNNSWDGSTTSTFVVRIPASITLSRKDYTTFEGTYTVGVKGVLGYDYDLYDILSVIPGHIDYDSKEIDGSFIMTGSSTGTEITAVATQEKFAWVYDWSALQEDEISLASEIKSDIFTDVIGTITTTVTVADSYTGTLGFLIILS